MNIRPVRLEPWAPGRESEDQDAGLRVAKSRHGLPQYSHSR